MTDKRMALAVLLEKGADGDLLREMIGYAAQRLMQLDVEGLLGVAHGQRGADRENWRNVCRQRDWHTRNGTNALRIPKLCRGSNFPAFLEPRRCLEKALAAVVQEAYIPPISTHSVDELVKSPGMTGMSKSQVSRLCAEIDKRVGAFWSGVGKATDRSCGSTPRTISCGGPGDWGRRPR